MRLLIMEQPQNALAYHGPPSECACHRLASGPAIFHAMNLMDSIVSKAPTEDRIRHHSFVISAWPLASIVSAALTQTACIRVCIFRYMYGRSHDCVP